MCRKPSSSSISPASPINQLLAIGESLMQASSVKISDICKKLEVSLSSSCPISFPLQPETINYHAFIVCNHDDSKWIDDLMRCLKNHVEDSNEGRGMNLHVIVTTDLSHTYISPYNLHILLIRCTKNTILAKYIIKMNEVIITF